MVHTDRRLAAVRDAGEAVIEVLDIGFREAKFNDAGGELEEDPRYGPCLEALRSALSEFDTVDISKYPEDPSVRYLNAERRFNDELLCSIGIIYRSEGSGQILLQVETANGTEDLVNSEGYELSSLQIGRYVAQAELAILVADLGSCAKAIDYWMKKEQNLTYDPKTGEYTGDPDVRSPLAPTWHNIRGVTKQAVSNNALSASNTLHNDSKDTDPWI